MGLAERFVENPDYGSGIYRRRMRFEKAHGSVAAQLLDDYHEMACEIRHDGCTILAVNASIYRAPFTTCPAATVVTKELEGLPLAMGREALYGQGRARRNCTHIFDLIGFAISQAHSDRLPTEIEFVVPDLTREGSEVRVFRDGQPVLDWSIDSNESIVVPTQYSGRSLFGGFVRWAEKNFSGFELELILHLQKVILVARGRRYLIRDESKNSIRDEPDRLGACFTFSEPQFSTARANPDYVRDFTLGLPRF